MQVCAAVKGLKLTEKKRRVGVPVNCVSINQSIKRNLETAVLGEKVLKQSLSTTYMMDQGR